MTTNTPSQFAAPILVAEDFEADFDSLREVAAAAGMTRVVHRVVSGGDCLALLREEGDAHLPLLPALIVMNLNSHVVDGREALVAIKTDVGLKEIPLVVLSTSGNPKDVAFCYAAGANAYNVKPVRHDHQLLLLGSVIHFWLESVTPHTALVKGDGC